MCMCVCVHVGEAVVIVGRPLITDLHPLRVQCLCVCVFVCVQACRHVRLRVCVYARACTCTCVCMCKCKCKYLYVYPRLGACECRRTPFLRRFVDPAWQREATFHLQ